MGVQRKGRAYYDPHPDTLLGFLSRGIYYLCEAPERTILNDESKRHLLEVLTRQTTENEFPELSAAKIEKLVAERLAAARTRVTAVLRKEELTQKLSPRPKQGNRRREVPRHQPLRPQALIIQGYRVLFNSLHPIASTNKRWEKVAKHLSQGLRACDADEGLEVWGVRSAENAFRDGVSTQDAASWAHRVWKRYWRRGKTHPWDRTLLEFCQLIDGDAEDLDAAAREILNSEVIFPLQVLEHIYNSASQVPEFRGWRGANLADALERASGFEPIYDTLHTLWTFRSLGIPDHAFFACRAG